MRHDQVHRGLSADAGGMQQCQLARHCGLDRPMVLHGSSSSRCNSSRTTRRSETSMLGRGCSHGQLAHPDLYVRRVAASAALLPLSTPPVATSPFCPSSSCYDVSVPLAVARWSDAQPSVFPVSATSLVGCLSRGNCSWLVPPVLFPHSSSSAPHPHYPCLCTHSPALRPHVTR